MFTVTGWGNGIETRDLFVGDNQEDVHQKEGRKSERQYDTVFEVVPYRVTTRTMSRVLYKKPTIFTLPYDSTAV